MQHRSIAIGWVSNHGYEIALAAALAVMVLVIVVAAPFLVAIAAVKYERGQRRIFAIASLKALVRAIVWLWDEFRGMPHGRWTPCAQCGKPIDLPSRAWYCSPRCRQRAQLQRAARVTDFREATRLAETLRPRRYDQSRSEVPF